MSKSPGLFNKTINWGIFLSLITFIFLQTNPIQAQEEEQDILSFYNQLKDNQYKNYLTKVGEQLIVDIQNQSEELFINYDMTKVYIETTFLPTLDKELSTTEILNGTLQFINQYRENYQEKRRLTKELIQNSNINLNELKVYSALYMNGENFKTPKDEVLDEIAAMFLIGNEHKKVVVLTSLVYYDGNYKVLELLDPNAYIDFSEGEYVQFYQSISQILSKMLETNTNSILGESVNEKWNKCSVQIYENVGLTYAKVEELEDEFFGDTYAQQQIYFNISKGVTYNQAYNLMADLVSILSQDYYISTNNNPSEKEHFYAFNNNGVMSEDASTGTTMASFSQIRENGNYEFCTIQFVITKTDDDKVDMDLWITREQLL